LHKASAQYLSTQLGIPSGPGHAEDQQPKSFHLRLRLVLTKL